jgi:hypothetical protein
LLLPVSFEKEYAISPSAACYCSAMARCFKPFEELPSTPDAHAELLASLERLTTFNPPVQTCSTGWTWHAFYSGPTSIALLFHRLSIKYPDFSFKSQTFLDWAEAYLQLGSHYLTTKLPTVDPSHCGIANETLCQLALQSLLASDSSLALRLCSYASIINSPDQAGSNEWLYGRAGYLYILRLVLTLLDPIPDSTRQRLIEATTATISRILSCPFPWTWHGKPYLGAVHGSMGIITQIILSADAIATPSLPNIVNQVKPYLLEILQSQFKSGNFPPSHAKGEQDDDRLVQFCHGSPGIVLSIMSIGKFYQSDMSVYDKFTAAIHNGQADIMARGLLTKSPCLCHGIPSAVLALSNGSEPHASRALAHMSTEMLEGPLGKKLGWLADAGHSDKYAGLYTGEAGRAWTWAVFDAQSKNDGRLCKAHKVLGYCDI